MNTAEFDDTPCIDCGHANRLHYALGHVGCHDLSCSCTRVPPPTVTDVLVKHRYGDVRGDYEVHPFIKWIACTGCDWRQNIAGMSGWRSWVQAHAEHVAEQLREALVETVALAMYDTDAQASADTWLSWTYLRGPKRDYWLGQARVYLDPKPCIFPECARIHEEGEHRFDPKFGCPDYAKAGVVYSPASEVRAEGDRP